MRALRVRLALAAVVLGIALALAALWAAGGFDALARAATSGQRWAQNEMAGGLRALKGGEAGAFWALMGIAFGYGVFHAAGPGHGKMLIGGYGLAAAVPVRRLVGIALASSLAQATTAVVLVYAGVLALGWTRQQIVGLTEATLAPLGHLAVAAVGLWLVLRGARGLLRWSRAGHGQGQGGPGQAGPAHAGHGHAQDGQATVGPAHHDHTHTGHAHDGRVAHDPARHDLADYGHAHEGRVALDPAHHDLADYERAHDGHIAHDPTHHDHAHHGHAYDGRAAHDRARHDLVSHAHAHKGDVALEHARHDHTCQGHFDHGQATHAHPHHVHAHDGQLPDGTGEEGQPGQGHTAPGHVAPPAAGHGPGADAPPPPGHPIRNSTAPAHDHSHPSHSHPSAPVCETCGHAHGPSLEQVAEVRSLRDALVLIAGIAVRPCSGALFLLILTWQMGIAGAGILGAYVMGLGTALVTVGVALLAGGMRAGTLASLAGTRAFALAVPALELGAGLAVALIAGGLALAAL